MRICLITSDVGSPVAGQDITTFCHHLATLLSQHGLEVSLLCPSPVLPAQQKIWTDHYHRLNVSLAFLESADTDLAYFGLVAEPTRTSQRIQSYLAKQSFDVVHCLDDGGAAFIPIQSKRVGIAHQDTVFTQMVHVPTVRLRQLRKEFPCEPLSYFVSGYCEQYAFSHSDFGIVPSSEVANWLEGNGWSSPGTIMQMGVPYCANAGPPHRPSRDRSVDRKHIILMEQSTEESFGPRILTSLGQFLTTDRHRITKVTLLIIQRGLTQWRTTRCLHSSRLIKEFPRVRFVVRKVSTYKAALDYVEQTRGIAIFSFFLRDLAYVILEAMRRHLSFLAPTLGWAGSIVEDKRVLFEPRISSLLEAVSRILAFDFRWPDHYYAPQEQNRLWLDFHDMLGSNIPRSRKSLLAQEIQKPLVSVCIPHFNMADHLETCLASLAANTYSNFEVICVDDGSTQPEDLDKVFALRSRYRDLNWRFVMSERGGVCRARNRAASLACGEFLVFVDADNVAGPEMIETMVSAIKFSDADCLSCHFDAFCDDRDRIVGNVAFRYCPLGPCLEVGCVENVLGDTNFIIRKQVFQELGGFTVNEEGATEDWELLLKLVIAGYNLDVIPIPLFWYRISRTSRTSTAVQYDSQQRALRPWLTVDPPNGFSMAFHVAALYEREHSPQITGLRQLLARTAPLVRAYLRSTRFDCIVLGLMRICRRGVSGTVHRSQHRSISPIEEQREGR